MKAATPTTHGINPNLKLFALIVATVVVAFVAFTVSKSAWDSHQEAAAQEQAQMQEATRQQQMAQQQATERIREAKQGELDQEKEALNSLENEGDLNGIHGIIGNYLKGINDQKNIMQNIDSPQGKQICVQQQAETQLPADTPEKCIAILNEGLDFEHKELEVAISAYNETATKVKPGDLPSDLPVKLDENGNPAN